jgi:hypothetical protein
MKKEIILFQEDKVKDPNLYIGGREKSTTTTTTTTTAITITAVDSSLQQRSAV